MKGLPPAIITITMIVLAKEKYAQPTAVNIVPRGYNASLDPEASFNFQCNATGADSLQWLVDGKIVSTQDFSNRGISESVVVTDEATRSKRRNLSIMRNIHNTNINNITCLASSFSPVSIVSSEPVVFKIQGLLDAPSNLMLSEADNQYMRKLSWDEPFSLDITDVDPDISHYKVCYNLIGANKSQCTLVNQTEFTFLNVNVPLLFTVSAMNVVGQGNTSSILHETTNCSSTTDLPIINASQIQTSVSSGNNPVARFLFQQLLGDITGIACFPVFRIESSPLTAANTTDHGIQIPGVVQYSSSMHLSLTVDSDLVVNEQYSATITAISADGMRGYNMTVEFDTYDVQSVGGRAVPGGLELSCTFAEGSQAQSCILTIYRILNAENSMEIFIANITISRENPQTSGRVSNLELGEYVVREVAEVESDGQLTIHRRRLDVLKLVINESNPTTTSKSTMLTPESPSTGGVSRSPTKNIGLIVGGVLGGICFIIIVVIVIIVVIMLVWYKKKGEEKNQNLLSESESVTGHKNSNLELADPTYAAIESSSEKKSQAIESTDNTLSTANQKLQNTHQDSPTFPLYTEVMGKVKRKAEEGDGLQPEVPQKQLTEEDIKELNLPTNEDVPIVPQQSLTTEDIQQMALSMEGNEETNSAPNTSNTPANHDQLLPSNGPQSSETLLKATAVASKGDPLYAELEHKKGKQIVTPPDMTGVQYSEIKTDEIPPRLPQKKSRKSRDHSSSSPIASARGSTTSLDTYKV